MPRILTPFFIPVFMCCMHVTVCGQYDSLFYDGYTRTYLVHLPANQEHLDNLPLIIAMHGGFGSAANLQNQSGLSLKADAEGFMVVYPEGVRDGILNIRTWNAGWCCGFASTSGVDDVGFINALLDTLYSRYSIDTSRVFATGMSNGGFMSYRLACEIPDRIAAIAPVACSMSVSRCDSDKPVPIIHFHSYLDGSVPYAGGMGNGVSNHHNPPLDSVAQVFGEINACQTKRDTLTHNDMFTHIRWNDCDCEAEINQYLTRDGGHSWPGGMKTAIGDPVSTYISANDLMWDFFQNYSLHCQMTTAENSSTSATSEYTIYPNPASDYINIRSVGNHRVEATLYNAIGTPVINIATPGEIDVSQLDAGMYFLQIQTRYQSTEVKVIVKH
ncbi:MAG: T9SS type A sorting domain-containing protein [Saprospiraceae bacterium]|nr:T9SS type A sorting domain-containing protein [Saprospiraceae bacterium]